MLSIWIIFIPPYHIEFLVNTIIHMYKAEGFYYKFSHHSLWILMCTCWTWLKKCIWLIVLFYPLKLLDVMVFFTNRITALNPLLSTSCTMDKLKNKLLPINQERGFSCLFSSSMYRHTANQNYLQAVFITSKLLSVYYKLIETTWYKELKLN